MGRESWSNEKLLFRLINNKSNKTYWLNISVLRKRASSTLLEQCLSLTKSKTKKEKIIGIDIISQLSNEKKYKPFSKEVINELSKMLRAETDPLVLISILYGIGHNNENLSNQKDIVCIANFGTSKNNKIRKAVIFALLGTDNPIAVKSLIELSKDKIRDIRSWAIFGLGSQIEKDSPQIRQALYDRIYDKHQETKYEAILGLAKRKDTRIKNVIQQELLTDSYGTLLLGAIEELQDISFIPILESTLIKTKKNMNINTEWIQKLSDCISYLNSLVN